MIRIPDEFARGTIDREGSSGRDWVARLPRMVGELCEMWALEPAGELLYGYLAIVLPVRRSGEEIVLKVGWLDEKTRDEALALRVWDGAGVVRLFECDHSRGALLLERLDPSVTLGSVGTERGVEIAAELLARLSVAAPAGFRALRGVAEEWEEQLPARWRRVDGELSRRVVDAAVDVCRGLGPSSASALVNEDLHFDNVLSGTREPWLVIDPKPLVGDPEFAVAPLLWSRLDDDVETSVHRRLAAVVDGARLDRDRARGWALARAVDFRLWGLSLGYTDGPRVCARIAEALVG